MAALLHDLHYGLRALARNRGFTLVAILSLAIGIGANTTVFTLVNAIWLRQIPVADPARLVSVHTVDPRNPGLLLCSYPNYKDLRDQNQVFSSLLLYSVITMSLTGRTDPQFLMGHIVSGNYFSTLGVNPVLGRGFLPEEDAGAGATVAVLSYAFWKRQFNGDPQVTAQTISLSGRVFNIVGVAPKGFQGLDQLYAADVWVPMAMAPIMYPYPVMLTQRRALIFSVAGRLRPDVGQAQAESAMQTLAVELERQYPENEGRRYKLISIAEASLPATTRTAMTNAGLLLFIISALVLLISCANLASLLLARGASRIKEIHIRLALGASRWQIIRQLLVESVLLGVLGGIAALVVAKVARDAVWALRPPSFNYSGIELVLDRRVLAYTLITSLLTGILSGLVPALRATRGDLATELKQRAGRAGSGGQWQLRSLLVSGQVAFSVVALVGASLFVRSMQNALRTDPGFAVAQLGIVAFNVADQAYSESRGREFQNRALQVAATTPGVVSAALRRDLPFRVTIARTVLLEGQDTGQGRVTLTTAVSPGYFQTMGIGLIRGRDFTISDSLAAPRTAIVNEAGAAHFWPGQDPIGRRFRLLGDPVPIEVVGIARNANYQTLGEQPQVMLYFSLMQFYSPATVLYVRTTGDPEVMSAAVRKEMQTLDRNLLLQSESVGKTIRESLWAQRLSGGLLAVFGVLALLLSTMGIYGVIGYSINQRTREFGVRMALGATALQVQKMILTEGVRLVTIGTVAGLVISVGASQAVRSMLFVVSPYDALTFVIVPSILTLVGALASWIPAMRTVHIDPAIALRDE